MEMRETFMTARRVHEFLSLVFRPHPYALPDGYADWWRCMLWPREAWRLAGLYAEAAERIG